MKETIHTYDTDNGRVYRFDSNTRYDFFVPLANIGTVEDRIEAYYSRRSNELRMSDVAECIKRAPIAVDSTQPYTR